MNKVAISILAVCCMVGCAGQKADSPPVTSDSTLGSTSETGYCSTQFLDRLNRAEYLYKKYQQSGLLEGGSLIDAHKIYMQLFSYKRIKCIALKKETQETLTITLSYIKNSEHELFNELYRVKNNCLKNPPLDYNQSAKAGCKSITEYLAESGY